MILSSPFVHIILVSIILFYLLQDRS